MPATPHTTPSRTAVAWAREGFGLSPAWLAVFRVAIASLLLIDLLGRARELVAHYTDAGVLPRAAVQAELLRPGEWSLHLLSGGPELAAGLFAVQIALAVALLLGLRPRLMAGLSFVLLGSLHVRNPMVVTGGDQLLRMMLFWSMFVPLGPVPTGDRKLASAGTAGVIVQLCCMYWVSFLLKTGAPWREDFSALAQALAFEHYTRPAGFWLLAHPELCKLLTIAVLVLEAIGPLLVVIPWRNACWRTLAVVGFCSFHLGIALTMELGLFPWVCFACWLALLPDALFPARLRAYLRARPYALGRAGTLIAISSLAYVLAWNVRSLDPDFDRSDRFCAVGNAAHLDQNWRLFTPYPPDDHGYFVVVIEHADGTSLDWLTGEAPTWLEPARVSAAYPDHRWRKFFLNLRDDERAPQRLHFAEYLCRSDPAAVSVELDYMPYRLLEHACAR
jgi:hypothetical protein